MPIDFHAHWIPQGLADALRVRTAPPLLKSGPNGVEFFDCGFVSLPMPAGFDDMSIRLAEMDRHGITHGVLSLTTFYGVDTLPAPEAVPLCRAFNDAVASACREHHERFTGLAALPIADMHAALAEFERAIALPGMIGAMLPGDGFLSLKRAERFRPFFAAADRRHAVILVHYGRLPGDAEAPRIDASDNSQVRYGTLDMQARLSSNMITFCFTDFLATYPNVTVLSHNLGGNIAYELERMDHRTLMDLPAGTELPSKRFRGVRMLVDCNSFGARGIERAVEVFGADKIVLGTDGTEFGMKWSRDAIAQARITPAEKHAILDGNAEAVLARARARAGLAAAA
jgi:predicted TIM-barrel fold metal-dependent hydrolase